MDSRATAIQEFSEAADIDRRIAEAISKVMAQSPRAVLIVWETDNAFGMTSVPFSRSLIKGMVDSAFDVIFGDTSETDDSES